MLSKNIQNRIRFSNSRSADSELQDDGLDPEGFDGLLDLLADIEAANDLRPAAPAPEEPADYDLLDADETAAPEEEEDYHALDDDEEEETLVKVAPGPAATLYVCETPAPSVPAGKLLQSNWITEEEREIVEGNQKGRYKELAPRYLTTFSPCNDVQSALYQDAVRRKANGKGRARLYASILSSLLGCAEGTKRNNYLEVIDACPVIRPVLKKTPGKVTKDYRPGFLCRSGKGRSIQYQIDAKCLREGAPRYSYEITGAPLARYLRALLAAEEKIRARVNEVSSWLLTRAEAVYFDVDEARKVCSEADGSDMRKAAGLFADRSWSIERFGRVHTSVSKCPKSMRPFLRVNGKKLTAIDLRWAHIGFVVLHAIRHWGLSDEAVSGLKALMATDPRSVMGGKEKALSWLNDHMGFYSCPEAESFWKEEHAEFYSEFRKHRTEMKDTMWEVYAELETEVIEDLIRELQAAGLSTALVAREGDGLRVIADQAAECLAVVNQVLATKYGLVLSAKVKSPEEERQDAVAERLAKAESLLVNRKPPAASDTLYVCETPSYTSTHLETPKPSKTPISISLVPETQETAERLVKLARDSGITGAAEAVHLAVAAGYAPRRIASTISWASKLPATRRTQALRKAL